MGDSSNTSDWYWILTVPPQSFDTFETKSPSTNPTVNTERICTIKISWHTLRQKKHLTIPFHAFAKVPIVGFHQCFGKIFHHEATLARHQTSSQQAICWSIDVLQSSAPKLGNPAYVYRLLMTCWGLVMSKKPMFAGGCPNIPNILLCANVYFQDWNKPCSAVFAFQVTLRPTLAAGIKSDISHPSGSQDCSIHDDFIEYTEMSLSPQHHIPFESTPGSLEDGILSLEAIIFQLPVISFRGRTAFK